VEFNWQFVSPWILVMVACVPFRFGCLAGGLGIVTVANRWITPIVPWLRGWVVSSFLEIFFFTSTSINNTFSTANNNNNLLLSAVPSSLSLPSSMKISSNACRLSSSFLSFPVDVFDTFARQFTDRCNNFSVLIFIFFFFFFFFHLLRSLLRNKRRFT